MIVEAIDIVNFLKQTQNNVIIDVRSPIEYQRGHVFNAINIPLFEDVERSEIGTLYKQKGKDVAVSRGLEIVSPKMISFVNQVKSITTTKVFIYCFRGGMRSNSFAWLMNTAGLDAKILKGGYKKYRNYVLNYFNEDVKIILLGGKTGSGKTDVLKKLSESSIQVVDLEKIANHKGSAFGSINEEKQHPQQIFENNLFQAFYNQNKSLPILLEDESQSIGYNKIPHGLWLKMKQATIIKLIIPFEARVQKLVQDYTTVDVEALRAGVLKISQRLGPNNTKLCLKYLNENNLADVARLSLLYYDKAYEFNYTKNITQKIISVESDTTNATINANKVKSILNSLS